METILQNTILNISKQEIYEKGFEYYKQLGVSIQSTDAIRTLFVLLFKIVVKNSKKNNI